jgi:hypothetical protein
MQRLIEAVHGEIYKRRRSNTDSEGRERNPNPDTAAHEPYQLAELSRGISRLKRAEK